MESGSPQLEMSDAMRQQHQPLSQYNVDLAKPKSTWLGRVVQGLIKRDNPGKARKSDNFNSSFLSFAVKFSVNFIWPSDLQSVFYDDLDKVLND